MSVRDTSSQVLTGKMGDCRCCKGCKHIGTDVFENAYYKVSCQKYPRMKGMGKPNCVVFDGIRCPWFEWDEETKLQKQKRRSSVEPIEFHQIVGQKTRVLLAEILLHQYDNCHRSLNVAFRSLSTDDVTAKRLAGVIFERFDMLDATIYEPVFESLMLSCFGPVNDYDQVRHYRFTDSFYTRLKSLDREQFEIAIQELIEKVSTDVRDEFDIRFEPVD